MAKNIQIVLTDEQLKALQEIAQAQVDALDCKARIYLDDNTQHALLKTFAEICKKLIEEGSEPSTDREPVDAYTKTESDQKYLAKTDAESTYQKKADAFTKTSADALYLGKTAKASSATTADSATKATQDSDGNPINTTYAKKTEALTKTTADGYYLGKTAKAASATTADSATTATTATSATTAGSATKATQDGDGNVISTTYAKKTELASYVTLEALEEKLAGYQPIA